MVSAQQLPFIPITGSNAPKSSSYLFEDRRGGLWLGGIEGEAELLYFDGARFVNRTVSGLPNSPISGMAEDGEGGILLVSSAGMYRVLRGALQTIIQGSAGIGITKIAQDVFLTSHKKSESEYYMMRVSRSGDTWTTERIIRVAGGIRFEPDAAGNILYPCERGFCEVRSEDVLKWQAGTSLPVVRHRAVSPPNLLVVKRDRSGCVWMRSGDSAAYQCRDDSEPVALPSQLVSAGYPEMSELADGSLLLPSLNQMAVGRPGHFRVITLANGYPGAAAHLVGKDGTVWISNGNGLYAFPWKLQMEFWTQREGLKGNTWSVVRVGTKVFAIAGDYIQVLVNDRARWRTVAEFNAGTQMIEGPNNTVLAGSRTQGVIQLSMESRILRRSDPTNVVRMARTADGTIWANGNGISTMHFGGNRISLDLDYASSPGGYVADMKIGREGDLWTCDAAGLLHKESGSWKHLSSGGNALSNWCRSFVFDRSGGLWYGANNVALIPHPNMVPFKIQERMSELAPHFLNTDQNERIWLGTANGVYLADPDQARQSQWLHLDRSDGLPGNDTNQRSFVNDKDGSVWFGIDNSVVHMFPPADLVHPTYAPSVFVSGFSSNNGSFQTADATDDLQNNSSLIAHIGSLQMDRRSAMNFRYRLLPQRSSWTNATNADINLGRVSWGDHKLEVQARLMTGPWSETASKSFHVLRPIWLSSPILLTLVFVGGVGVVGGTRWRRLRKQRDDTPLPKLAAWRLAVVSPEAASLQGALLDDRFEVARIVARGGFATIWEGHDRQQKNQLCAIKIFRHELLDKSWMEKRFQHEVSALTQIHHPNVVRIYGHGTAPNGAPYLAMEFIPGQTLRDKLREGPPSIAQTASYLRQASSALAEIHAHGVCHRDVKPENLMIRTNGEDLVLIDFSIAIVQDPDETMHGLSRAAGTMHYMAPEQAIGYANESSDIYSLAKILIEMLTGQRLSTLLPDASIDLPDRVRELQLGLSPASIDLLARALEFDPSKRPRNAKAFGFTLASDLET